MKAPQYTARAFVHCKWQFAFISLSLPSFLAAVQINFAELRAFPPPPLIVILKRPHRFRKNAAALH